MNGVKKRGQRKELERTCKERKERMGEKRMRGRENDDNESRS
jgi:hypothetical protein